MHNDHNKLRLRANITIRSLCVLTLQVMFRKTFIPLYFYYEKQLPRLGQCVAAAIRIGL